MKNCNLSIHDYNVKNLWVGTGHTSCTDPETLRTKIATRPIDLGIKVFDIYDFNHAKHLIFPNDSSLRWTPTYRTKLNDCLTLSIPETLIKLGIYVVSIFIHDPPFPNLNVYVHQKGLLFTETPDAWQQIEVSGEGLSLPIVHEVEDLLSFDSEQCEDSKDYIFDQCKLNHIRKVITKFS